MKITINKGDIMLVNSSGILPVLIQFFMNFTRWIRFDFKPFYKTVSNHAGVGIGNNQCLEAVAKGVYSMDIDSHYATKKNTIVKIYSFDWNTEQLRRLDLLASIYLGVPYEYSNFLVWLLNRLTLGLVWIGKSGTKASRKMYCSEVDATIMHYITSPDTMPNLTQETIHNSTRAFWRKSPYDIEVLCEKYGTLKDTYSTHN